MAGVKFDVEVDQGVVQRFLRSDTSVTPSSGMGDIDTALAHNLLKRGMRVERKAKLFLSGQRVNVDTGRLRSSVHAELFRQPNGQVGIRIGTDVYYGRFLNDGTRHIRPRLWLTDALDAAR
jgi:hypothetical protein